MGILERTVVLIAILLGPICALGLRAAEPANSVTVPFTLDHNRTLVTAEFRRPDGSWRRARLWVDSGNPAFLMSEALAKDLAAPRQKAADGELEVPPPAHARVGAFPLDFSGVKATVETAPSHFLATAGADANLPSTVLRHCRVILDYRAGRLTLAKPGLTRPGGVRVPCTIHPDTGILQFDGSVGGERASFALDMGASYTLLSADLLSRLSKNHPGWPSQSGAIGCANMWGWPQEPAWPMLRIGDLALGAVRLEQVGAAGLPQGVFDWYSKKTAAPVSALLGPNALKGCRVEIDYESPALFIAKDGDPDRDDMDLVGLTLSREAGGAFEVTGVEESRGLPAAEGVAPGDKLLAAGGRKLTGGTLGAAVDSLRGKPGEAKTLELERDGRRFVVRAPIQRYL